MDKKIRVLLVDDNINYINKLKQYFSSSKAVEVIDASYDGVDAYEKIRSNDYDVVVMDVILPKKDGLSVIEQLKKEKVSCKFIVASGYNSLDIIKRASNIGVSYYMLKPFVFDDLENHIIKIVETKKIDLYIKDVDLEKAISALLHSLGIPSHIKGFQYIREGIELMYKDPSLIGAITKEMYPEIALKYDTTSSRVERAIRHAIEVSWSRGDYNLMEEIFGHSVDYDRAKPTNSEFIATLADKLRLEKIAYV